jgi:hypothetical protein
MPNQGGSAPESHQLFERYSPPEQVSSPEQRPEGSEWGDYLTEIQDLYTKQGPAAQAYSEHLNAIPQYQKPGWGTRIGAALVGGAEGMRSGAASGWQAGQMAAQAPYRRSLEEWGMKEQALGRNAEIEDESTNRRLQYMKEVRSIAKDSAEARRWMDEYDLKVRDTEADNQFKRDQLVNTERHNRAQEKMWQDQGFVKDYDKAGNIIFVNPRTGEIKNSGTASSKVRDWDLEGQRIGVSRENTGIARRNATTNEQRLGLERERETRVAGREDRYENPPISASEQSAARASALSRAQIENPDMEFTTPEGGIDLRMAKKYPDQFRQFMKRVEEIESSMFGRRRNLGGTGGGGGEIEY